MDKYILGLDPSTKSTGYSVTKNGQLIESGVITAGSANLYNRIHKIMTELKIILDKYNFSGCIVEDVIPEDVRGNHNVFKPLMYLQGFLCDLLNDYNIKPDFYLASEWRKRCGIKTGAGVHRESLKKKDKLFVKRMYNLDVNDDEADAICINFAYTHEPLPVVDEEITKDEFGFEFG